jgi:hypothetical protein
MLKINPKARELVKELAKHARRFPNVGLAGHYDPFTQVVVLDSIEEKHLNLIRDTDDYTTKKSYLPLLMHEIRHWFDHISTVWGRQQIVAMYNAMNARKNDKPQEFHRIPAAMRGMTLDAFPRYFSTVSPDEAVRRDRRKWLYQMTSGQRFSYEGHLLPNRPILFTRFATQSNEDACRCPFSIDSLLETGSVRDEIAMTTALISQLPDDAKLIEEKQFKEATINRLYNPELVKYSVAAHGRQLAEVDGHNHLLGVVVSFGVPVPKCP